MSKIITTVKGCLKDEPDNRDYDFNKFKEGTISFVNEPKEEIYDHTIPDHTPISNQGRAGSCVANGICDMFEILDGIQKGSKNVRQYSRRFLYWIARVYRGSTTRDNGTTPRSAFRQLHHIGIIEECFYTYRDSLEAITQDAPSLSMYTMASNHKINSYYRLTDSRDEIIGQIEYAINRNYPVGFCIPVDKDFQRYRGEDKVFDEMGSPVGNHFMVIIGFSVTFDSIQFLVRNSWGTQWGMQGRCWMDQKLIKEKAFGLWVATKA